MWYAIQTMTGREQELIDTVDARTDHNTYERCFCVRREAVWRREGRYITHIEPLFPGYVFVETQDPEAFYLQLKKIPKFSRLLGKDIREKTAGTPEHRTDGRTGKKTEKRTSDPFCGQLRTSFRNPHSDSSRYPACSRPANPVLRAAGEASRVGEDPCGRSICSRPGLSSEESRESCAVFSGNDSENLPKSAFRDPERVPENFSPPDGFTYSEHLNGPGISFAPGSLNVKIMNCSGDFGSRPGKSDEGILFHAVSEEEEAFLKQLIGDDPDNIVRLSPVELDENSEIIKCGGALRYYKDAIIKKRIRLRYVVVRVPLFGRNRDVLLGIRVEKEKILNMLDRD